MLAGTSAERSLVLAGLRAECSQSCNDPSIIFAGILFESGEDFLEYSFVQHSLIFKVELGCGEPSDLLDGVVEETLGVGIHGHLLTSLVGVVDHQWGGPQGGVRDAGQTYFIFI